MARVKYVVYTKSKKQSGGHWVERGECDCWSDAVERARDMYGHDRVMIAKVEEENGLEK